MKSVILRCEWRARRVRMACGVVLRVDLKFCNRFSDVSYVLKWLLRGFGVFVVHVVSTARSEVWLPRLRCEQDSLLLPRWTLWSQFEVSSETVKC